MRILLQFPQGLKQKAVEEAEKLRREGHDVFLSATPCWGACDLALDEAKKIKAERLIHYGHAQYHEVKDKGLTVEYRLYPITVDLEVLRQALPHLAPYRRLGLVTTVSHIHQLEDMKRILREGDPAHPHEVLTARGGLAILEGQVLGCDSSAADKLVKEVDATVYFGGGEFHPLGIGANKPVLSVSPYARTSYFLNEKIEKKRKQMQGMLIAASQAKRIGILVSTKSGQFNLLAAEAARKKLAGMGIESEILVTAEVDFGSLADFNSFDAYITTACPRLVDDYERVGKPIVNLTQMAELFELAKKTRE